MSSQIYRLTIAFQVAIWNEFVDAIDRYDPSSVVVAEEAPKLSLFL